MWKKHVSANINPIFKKKFQCFMMGWFLFGNCRRQLLWEILLSQYKLHIINYNQKRIFVIISKVSNIINPILYNSTQKHFLDLQYPVPVCIPTGRILCIYFYVALLSLIHICDQNPYIIVLIAFWHKTICIAWL